MPCSLRPQVLAKHRIPSPCNLLTKKKERVCHEGVHMHRIMQCLLAPDVMWHVAAEEEQVRQHACSEPLCYTATARGNS